MNHKYNEGDIVLTTVGAATINNQLVAGCDAGLPPSYQLRLHSDGNYIATWEDQIVRKIGRIRGR